MKLSITEWDEKDRPRQKLMTFGAEALTNAELLAIIIGTGSQQQTAVGLMQRLLSDCGNNINTLGKLSLHELMQYHGVGQAKAISIIAACELGRRRQHTAAPERQRFDNAQSIYQYMLPKMQDLDVEEARVLLLNQNYKYIKDVRLSHGGITETAVDIRIIVREAVLHNATVVALCHNHPSGNPRPSRDDDRLTERVKKACEIMRLYLLDHVIIADGEYYSYQQQGKL